MAFSAPVKRNSDARPLRGSEKVAALLLAMGRELSGGVLKEFDPEGVAFEYPVIGKEAAN